MIWGVIASITGWAARFDRAHTGFLVYLDWLRWGRVIVSGLIGVIVFGLMIWMVRPLVLRIRKHADVLEGLARIDALTGALNRRAIFAAGEW